MIPNARFWIAGLLIAGLAVAACGGSEDESAPAATTDTPAAVPAQPDKPATNALSSKHNPELKGALPADFPEDVPLHPGAELVFSRASQDLAMSVRQRTGDSADDVASQLDDAFAAQGWATQRTDRPDGFLIVADKLSRKAAATITEADGQTEINILVTSLPR